MKKRPKVIVAMSGGVDSSVAAYLLKKRGYDVIGVFMKFWSPCDQDSGDKSLDLLDENRCYSVEAANIARAVASKLDFPFYVINLVDSFKKEVVDYFFDQYQRARTPNPCVACNQKIKFDALLSEVHKLGADYLATGHYIRLGLGAGKKLVLFKAKDQLKDQSYFLWTLGQEQLKYLLFPLGEYTKKEVRAIAQKMDLPSANRPDSHEICFVGKDLKGFLSRNIPSNPGPIKDLRGKVISKHPGLFFYTIGQRTNLGLGDYPPLARAIDKEPLYVIQLEKGTNSLIVGPDRDLYKKYLEARDSHWMISKVSKFPLNCRAKIRYGQPDFPVSVEKQNNRIKVKFNSAQRAITPGQSIVFYNRNQLLGGAIIDG
jgi:tRNA-specific 2-thiouridylase